MNVVEYVVIIQCDIALKRCSGFACTNAFYNRDEMFENYTDNVKYISFSCDGCCGKGVSSKLEHLSRKLKNKTDFNKGDTAIHLSSCMTTDNYHYDRCPHIDYIKSIVVKKGYENIIEGTYISEGSKKKRKTGIYKDH